jgi:hypothetical protein
MLVTESEFYDPNNVLFFFILHFKFIVHINRHYAAHVTRFTTDRDLALSLLLFYGNGFSKVTWIIWVDAFY